MSLSSITKSRTPPTLPKVGGTPGPGGTVAGGRGFVMDDKDIYWITFDEVAQTGSVMRCSQTSCSPTTLASNVAHLANVAIDGSRYYYGACYGKGTSALYGRRK